VLGTISFDVEIDDDYVESGAELVVSEDTADEVLDTSENVIDTSEEMLDSSEVELDTTDDVLDEEKVLALPGSSLERGEVVVAGRSLHFPNPA
jgi:hypothetical protein